MTTLKINFQGTIKMLSDFGSKAELLKEGTFSLIHLFARDILVVKKLEIEKN